MAVHKIVDKKNSLFLMNVYMKHKISFNLGIMILMAVLMSFKSLMALEVPVYFDWKSSNSVSIYNIYDFNSTRIKQEYRINLGVDTLFCNNIRTSVEIGNRNELLNSKVVFKHVIIDYNMPRYYLTIAMHDFGYGNNFFLYNRSYDDYYFNENVLLNSRWYGLHSGLKYSNHSLGIGIGTNEVNWLLCEANYKFSKNMHDFILYHHFNLRDNDNTVEAYDTGAEIGLDLNKYKLHSGFNYTYQPVSFAIDEMDKWYLINEIQVRLSPKFNAILSLDLQTKRKDKTTYYVGESCLNYTSNKYQSNIGLRAQNVLSEVAFTPFWDFSYELIDKLSIGIVNSLTLIKNNDAYYKFAFQTSYRID